VGLQYLPDRKSKSDSDSGFVPMTCGGVFTLPHINES
jgi:hypothetical protein